LSHFHQLNHAIKPGQRTNRGRKIAPPKPQKYTRLNREAIELSEDVKNYVGVTLSKPGKLAKKTVVAHHIKNLGTAVFFVLKPAVLRDFT